LDEWPMAYALYQTRTVGDESQALPHGSALTIPEELHNSEGYAVRGKTRVRRLSVFCHSEWQGYERPYWISDYPAPRETWDSPCTNPHKKNRHCTVEGSRTRSPE
jgi:hypothetical protein